MREIKFRFWLKGTMVFPPPVQEWDFEDCCFVAEYSKNNVMQFTGLLDKNGKDIYEGDIITCAATQRETNDVIEKGEKIQVKYSDGYFYPFGYNCGWRSSVDDIEIIGNIYENPELLK